MLVCNDVVTGVGTIVSIPFGGSVWEIINGFVVSIAPYCVGANVTVAEVIIIIIPFGGSDIILSICSAEVGRNVINWFACDNDTVGGRVESNPPSMFDN